MYDLFTLHYPPRHFVYGTDLFVLFYVCMLIHFLSLTSSRSSRVFSIPYYPHTLKWKRSGSLFKVRLLFFYNGKDL